MNGTETIYSLMSGSPTILAILFFGAIIAVLVEMHTREKWKEAGQELGLSLSGVLMFRQLHGEVDTFPVSIRPKGKHGHFEIIVEGRGRMSRELSLGVENVFTRTVAGPDIQTGHPAFDYQARIHGDSVEALALLDHTTRQHVVRDIVEGGARVGNGRITLVKRKFEDVPQTVRRLAGLAWRLSIVPGEIAERLALNATTDPLPSVRIRCLEVLRTSYGRHDATRDAHRAALGAEHPNLRLAGAAFLGEEGLPALRELLLDETGDTDVRQRALRHFLDHAPAGEAVPVLQQLLDAPPAGMLPAIVRGLGRQAVPELLARTVDTIDRLDDETALDLAVMLETAAEDGAEPVLLRLLEREADTVRAAAAQALARHGTIRAVEPLLALTRGLRSSGRLKVVAQEAIRQIQSRLGDVEAGRLSLVTPAGEEGALSLAGGEDPAGALSLSGDAEGEGTLSLSDEADGTGTRPPEPPEPEPSASSPLHPNHKPDPHRADDPNSVQ